MNKRKQKKKTELKKKTMSLSCACFWLPHQKCSGFSLAFPSIYVSSSPNVLSHRPQLQAKVGIQQHETLRFPLTSVCKSYCLLPTISLVWAQRQQHPGWELGITDRLERTRGFAAPLLHPCWHWPASMHCTVTSSS